VVGRVSECPGDRGRAAAAWVLDLGRGWLRPRAPVVPLRAAGVLAGAAAGVPLSAWPARDAAGWADRRAGRPASAGHAGGGGRAGDSDRGGVRPRREHRRVGGGSPPVSPLLRGPHLPRRPARGPPLPPPPARP